MARDRQAQAKQRTSRRARALPRLDSGVWTIAATAILGLSLAIIGLLGVPSQTLGPQAARQAEPTSNVTTPVIAAAPEKSSADTPSLDERYSGRSLGLRQEGRYVGVSIRDLPVATWILATNPETPGNAGFDYGQVDPAELRIVRLRLEKPDGGLLHIDKLAFAARVSADGLAQGAWMYVEYEELGIANYGEIREIRRCPPIPPRPSPDHCLVTAKFEHSAGDLLNLHVAGLDEPLGVTPNHPIWSEDRQQFLRADELDHGEMLRTAHDQLIRVASLAPARESAAVYNLEVDGEHVYYVSPIGILVHNSKGDGYLAPNSLPNINKAVNSNIAHAAERAVERGVFPDKKPAADALRELSKKLTANGLPPGTIPDPKRADSVLVPFGNGWAVYELKANGTAILRTVLGAN